MGKLTWLPWYQCNRDMKLYPYRVDTAGLETGNYVSDVRVLTAILLSSDKSSVCRFLLNFFYNSVHLFPFQCITSYLVDGCQGRIDPRVGYCTGHVWIIAALTITNGSCLKVGRVDVITWKHFPNYWPFARRIHYSISLTKAYQYGNSCFLCYSSEQAVEETIALPVLRDTMVHIRRHRNVTIRLSWDLDYNHLKIQLLVDSSSRNHQSLACGRRGDYGKLFKQISSKWIMSVTVQYTKILWMAIIMSSCNKWSQRFHSYFLDRVLSSLLSESTHTCLWKENYFMPL